MGTTYKDWRMVYDYHTHTVFSHGKGTIEENVRRAVALGLTGIAITDHGPGHLTYGIKRKNIPVMRAEIERLKKIYTNIEIFMGVEANIVPFGNHLDVTKEEFGDYDFVIAGYHYGVLKSYSVKNYINEHTKGSLFGKSLLVRNTEMAVKAIYENRIKILTHPCDKGPFDVNELAKACEDTGTLLEISTWHKHLTLDEIKKVSKFNVKFIVSSDAHTVSRVGDGSDGICRAEKAGLDLERIVNITQKEG